MLTIQQQITLDTLERLRDTYRPEIELISPQGHRRIVHTIKAAKEKILYENYEAVSIEGVPVGECDTEELVGLE